MKSKWRTTLIFSVTAALLSLCMLFTFRITMTTYVSSNAQEIISGTEKVVRGAKAASDDNNRLYGEIIYLEDDFSKSSWATDHDWNISSNYLENHDKELNRIVKWAKRHAHRDKLTFASIGGSHYYLKLEKVDGQLLIIFADVSPEYRLISYISLVLWVVLFISLLVAGAVGLILGRYQERDSQKQKEFFENASHDLKTPLMVIQGYADGVASGLMPADRANQAILKETEKMTKLVNEILHLSRLESGALKLQKTSFSLQELLDNCLYHIDYPAQEKGIAIEQDIVDTMVVGDPQQLERALSNILDNSLRYAQSKITLQANPKEIIIANDGRLLTSDEGKHLFDRFYTGKGGLSGIGLALTQEIIRQHGWKIKAYNQDEQVVFYIKLK